MFKVIGVNDDKDFCECCGKSGLKSVVWIENMETGEIKHFGTTCARKPHYGFPTDEIKKAMESRSSKIKAAWRRAHSKYRKDGGKYEGDLITGLKAVNRELLEKYFHAAMTVA